jgi:HEAT repeat protein
MFSLRQRVSLLTLATICLAALPGRTAEPTADVRPALARMASKGSQFDPQGLHQQGVAGLSAVLDYLLPDTARPSLPRADEKAARELIGQLADDDVKVRDRAVEQLTLTGRPLHDLILQVMKLDDVDVQRRARRIISAWDGELHDHVAGFRNYLDGIRDHERLDLLAQRSAAALSNGLPDAGRRDILGLAISAVVRVDGERYGQHFLPLLKHADVKVAALTVETVGGAGPNPAFPKILLAALNSDRKEVVGKALDWTPHTTHSPFAEEIKTRLGRIFTTGSDELKFQAAFPLMHTYGDAAAFRYLLTQTQSTTYERQRTAIYWVGDACHSGKTVTAEILEKLVPLLQAKNDEIRRAATYALGTYQGEKVVQHLLPTLGDPQAIIVVEAGSKLLDQRDRDMLRRQLADAAKAHVNLEVRKHAAELLKKVK